MKIKSLLLMFGCIGMLLFALSNNTIKVNAKTIYSSDLFEYAGHYYYVFGGSDVSWEDAQKECINNGGYLVSFSSKEENDVVWQYVRSKEIGCVWIGLYNSGTKDVPIWNWVNGDVVGYTNWNNSQPDYKFVNNEYEGYAGMGWRGTEQWDDFDSRAGDVRGYVCEWDNGDIATAKAIEFENVKAYEMSKFEDVYNFADYATPIVSSDGQYRGLFKIEIEERGMLYFSNYSSRECDGMWDVWGDPNYPIGVYAYKSQNMLSTIEQQGRWQERLNGSTYTSKYDFVYYLMPGTYYFEIKTLKNNDKNLVFMGFLSDSKVLKIEQIEYTDSEQARIKFNDIGGYSYAYIAEGDMLDPEWRASPRWVSIYESNYDNTGLEDNTFTITGYGTYTLYVSKDIVRHNNLAATADWKRSPLMVTFTLEKTKVLPKKIKISKTKLTLKEGAAKKLTVKITPENTTETKITWKTSNKKVATVSKTGKVTAKKKGTCTITAVTSNGKKAKCKITVKK